MYYLNSRYYNPEIGRFINADGQIGKVGDILGHNLYAYAANNPFMNIDPNGKSPWSWLKDRWSDTKEWVTGAYDDTKEWLNEVPDNSFTIPSSSDFLPSVIYNLYGGAFAAKDKLSKVPVLGKISTGLSIFTLAFDVGNTWFDESSSNTRLQRFEKTYIQFYGAAAQFAVGYVGTSMIVAGAGAAPETGGFSLIVSFAGLGIIMKGGEYIERGQNYLYDKLDID